MNLEDFVASELRKTKFYDKDNNMFHPCVSLFIEKDAYIEMYIEDMISVFVGQYASKKHKQSDYKVSTEHVSDSPGLDKYITFISYAEYDGEKVNIEAFTLDSYCC